MAMLDKVLRLYSMAMAYDVRSPMPHLVGPPGCGKSSVIEELANLLGVELHIINVSRLSPLDVEGVQMPHGSGEDMVLRMLPATFWTSLHEGDILLMDEFLRGFPEVYNALLDIFTSRRVGAYRLPKVFIIGASNSTVSYDGALEDRLLHLPVADPRRSRTERTRMAGIIVDALGLLPEMAQSSEMEVLLREEVLPMYDILDSFSAKKGRKVVSEGSGTSLRKLIGQAQLRMVTSLPLAELIEANNGHARAASKWQYVLLMKVNSLKQHAEYIRQASKLRGNPKLTPVQALNMEMNFQLLELEAARRETPEEEEDSNG